MQDVNRSDLSIKLLQSIQNFCEVALERDGLSSLKASILKRVKKVHRKDKETKKQ